MQLSKSIVAILFVAPLLIFAQSKKALVIGVGAYPNLSPEEHLKYANADALAFADALRSDALNRFDVKVLIDEEASRASILEAVEDIKTATGGPPDTLYVFFSGHAELDQGTADLYLLPSDTVKNRLSSHAVEAKLLIDQLKTIGSHNLIVFLDACGSGAAIGNKGNTSDVKTDASLSHLFSNLSRGAGIQMMFASASASESSWEDDEMHLGIFTRFVVDGLKGAADGAMDGAKDDVVTAGELKAYLDREVPRRARELRRVAQTPLVSPDFEAAFPLSNVRSFSSVKPPSRADIQRLLSKSSDVKGSDPELSAMLRLAAHDLDRDGVVKGRPTVGPDLSDLVGRVHKSNDLRGVVEPDAIVDRPTITRKGEMLLACLDRPSRSIAVSLTGTPSTRTLSLDLPNGRNGRQSLLDSCGISASRDGLFAILSLTNDARHPLAMLVDLSGDRLSTVKIWDGRSGVFFGDSLALTGDDKVAVFSTSPLNEITSQDVSNDISPGTRNPATHVANLKGDPDSDALGIAFEDHFSVYRVSRQTRALERTLALNAVTDCGVSQDLEACSFVYNGNASLRVYASRGPFIGNLNASLSYSAFPSGKDSGNGGYQFAFQNSVRSRLVQFIDATGRVSASIELPEAVFAGRLLADGNAVFVGAQGGVYRFNTTPYADCCGIRIDEGSHIVALVPRENKSLLVVSSGTAGQRVQIFRSRQRIFSVLLPSVSPISRAIWADPISTAVLASADSVRVMAFSLEKPLAPTTKILSCSAPIAFDHGSRSVACGKDDSSGIEIYSLRTGRDQTIAGQFWPLHAIQIGPEVLHFAGVFPMRRQVSVGAIRLQSRKLLFQRPCGGPRSVESSEVDFLDRGAQLAQLESGNSIVVVDTMTCAPEGRFLADEPLGNLRAAGLGSLVVALSLDRRTIYCVDGSTVTRLFAPSFGLPVEDFSVAPDGSFLVMKVGTWLLQIPYGDEGIFESLRASVTRQFSAAECQEFFSWAHLPNF